MKYIWFVLALFTVQATAQPSVKAQKPLEAALVAEALATNPEIQAARREREAAQLRILPAGALDDPMLEFGVLNVPTNSLRFDREDMTMKMIGLSQRFPYPGKRDLRQDVATKDAETIEFGFQETVNRVVRDVRTTYLDLSLTVEMARLVERNKQIVEQLLRITEGRYSAGIGRQTDVLKAQTQLSKMTDELLKLTRERQTVGAELNRVLGRSTKLATPIPEVAPLREENLNLELLRDAALSQRPQLRALQSIVSKNDKALDLARKEYYPDFDVRLSYGQRDRMPDGAKRSDMVSLTVAINLPVWRETKRAPRVAEALAIRDQAQSLYEAQRNEVATRLSQQVAVAEQNLKSARLYQTALLPQARLTVESTMSAYRVNQVDFLTLIESQMTVFNYEINLVTASTNYKKALAEIDFLSGKLPE
jgi:cobalt-zinc-cadmium efflux system outer membrane protein